MKRFLKYTVTAIVVGVSLSLPAFADEAELNRLFEQLKSADAESIAMIEQEIVAQWSRSGSPAADLLLQRGREALVAGDLETAIAHLTALTDYAPDFAEGWNARATAYFQAGKLGPSVADIGRVLELNPRHFGAMSGLALILEELGNPKKALEVYRKIEVLAPERPSVKDAIERLGKETGGQDI